jgi:indole-3-glycerol phosphate synthase
MILKKIIEQTKHDLIERKRAVSLDQLIEQARQQEPARDFAAALSKPDSVNIIAEVKKASPSKGVICPDFDPVRIARCYEENGAGAVSVLTEEHFFQGHLDYLKLIRSSVSLPLLRKDFIIDPYQVYEARAAGADALLLIAAVLDTGALSSLMHITQDLGMHALVEVHNDKELKNALIVKPSIIGINNRNLNTFITDIETTVQLRSLIPEGIIIVSESGINTPADIKRLRSCDIDAFLIGESLMREPDPGIKLGKLLCA